MSTESFTLCDLRRQMIAQVQPSGTGHWLTWIMAFLLPRDVRRMLHDPKSPFHLYWRHQIGIIDAMTPDERMNPKCICRSRLIRIAFGAGVTVFDVETLLVRHSQVANVPFLRLKRQYR